MIEPEVRELAAVQHQAYLDDLVKERETIRNKLKLILDRFDPEMRDLIDDEITVLKTQLRSVNERISRCESVEPTDDKAISETVDQTVTAIHDLATTLTDAAPTTLRSLLNLLVSRLVVDLETRDVELEISLPSTVNAGKLRMCLVGGLACKSYNETHQPDTMAIAVYRLTWDRRRRVFRKPPRIEWPDVSAA